jgi:glutamate--cysteine ligase
LDISASGLRARARLNGAGDDETGYLNPLRDIVALGKTPAEQLLDLYHGSWGGDLSKVYEDVRF